jgi:hypothetical protein
VSEKLTALSAEWWEARKKILGGIASQSRKRGVKWTEAQVKRSENAMLCAEGDEDGQIAFERNGFTREQWFKKHFPQALEGGEISPADRMRLLRKAMVGVL